MTKLVKYVHYLWGHTCGDLQARLDRLVYRAWVRGAALTSLANGVATIAARSALQPVPLVRREGTLIAECLSARLNRPIRVVITLGADVPEELSVSTPPGPGEEAALARSVAPLPRPATVPGPHGEAAPPVLAAPPGHPSAPPAGPPVPPAGPPAPAAASAAPADDPAWPAWVSPTLWATVPPVLRPALVGSTLRDGQLVPAKLFFKRALDDARYAELLARLIAAATPVRSA